jgi:hypothetical protein
MAEADDASRVEKEERRYASIASSAAEKTGILLEIVRSRKTPKGCGSEAFRSQQDSASVCRMQAVRGGDAQVQGLRIRSFLQQAMPT